MATTSKPRTSRKKRPDVFTAEPTWCWRPQPPEPMPPTVGGTKPRPPQQHHPDTTTARPQHPTTSTPQPVQHDRKNTNQRPSVNTPTPTPSNDNHHTSTPITHAEPPPPTPHTQTLPGPIDSKPHHNNTSRLSLSFPALSWTARRYRWHEHLTLSSAVGTSHGYASPPVGSAENCKPLPVRTPRSGGAPAAQRPALPFPSSVRWHPRPPASVRFDSRRSAGRDSLRRHPLRCLATTSGQPRRIAALGFSDHPAAAAAPRGVTPARTAENGGSGERPNSRRVADRQAFCCVEKRRRRAVNRINANRTHVIVDGAWGESPPNPPVRGGGPPDPPGSQPCCGIHATVKPRILLGPRSPATSPVPHVPRHGKIVAWPVHEPHVIHTESLRTRPSGPAHTPPEAPDSVNGIRGGVSTARSTPVWASPGVSRVALDNHTAAPYVVP